MAPHTPPTPDISLDLALAVVASSDAPLLLLNSALTIVAASRIDATDQTMPSRCATRMSTHAAPSVSNESVSTVVTPYGTSSHGLATSIAAIANATRR